MRPLTFLVLALRPLTLLRPARLALHRPRPYPSVLPLPPRTKRLRSWDHREELGGQDNRRILSGDTRDAYFAMQNLGQKAMGESLRVSGSRSSAQPRADVDM